MGLLGSILEPQPQGGLLDLAMNLAIAGGSGAPTMAGLAQAGQATRKNMLQARDYQQEQEQYARQQRLQELQERRISEMKDPELREMLEIVGPEGYAQIMASTLKGRYGGENTPDMWQEYQLAVAEAQARGATSVDQLPEYLQSYEKFVPWRKESLGQPVWMAGPNGMTPTQFGTRGSVVTGAPGTPAQFDPNVQGGISGAERDAVNASDRGSDRQSKAPVMNSFNVGMNALDTLVARTMTGGPLGSVGAVGRVLDYQDRSEFDSYVQQVSGDLRAIFRIPGEGTLSDREQAQYGLQLPSSSNDPAVNKRISALLRQRVQARLGGGGEQQAPPAAGASGRAVWGRDANGKPVRVR